MKTKLPKLLALGVIAAGLLALMVNGWSLRHGRWKAWSDSETAGFAVFAPGWYERWHLRFSDGTAFVDGKWQSVRIVQTEKGESEIRPGRYAIPKFEHVRLDVAGWFTNVDGSANRYWRQKGK
jgi:hypothetical protein